MPDGHFKSWPLLCVNDHNMTHLWIMIWSQSRANSTNIRLHIYQIKWITSKLCIILPFSRPVELKVKITHVHKGSTSWVCQHHQVHDSWYTEIPMSVIESHINHCMVSQDRPLLMYCERCNVLRQPCVADMTFKWFFWNWCKLQPVCCFGNSDTDTSDRGFQKAQSQRTTYCMSF